MCPAFKVFPALSDHSDHHKPLPALASRYACALYDLAMERSQLAMVEADLSALDKAVAQTSELKTLLQNPLQPRASVAKALGAVLQNGKAAALTQNFLHIVVMNGRANVVPVILKAFFAKIAEAKGIKMADITSARALTDASLSAIKGALLSALADKGVKDIILKTQVNADLLGGMRVQVGSMLYDGSLQGKLEKLGQALK